MAETQQIDINAWADFWYYDVGANVIPAITKKKAVTEKWSQWQITPIPEELFKEWKSTNRFEEGIGVIVGKVWRGVRDGKYLTFIDCDNGTAIKEFCTKDGKTQTLEDAAKIFLVEQHKDNPNKAHIFFFSEEPFPKKGSDVLEKALVKENEQVEIPLFEVKGRGSHGIAFVTPSMHKDGYRYEILGTKDPLVLNIKQAEEMKKHLDSICRKYDLHYLENVDTSGNIAKTPVASLFEDDFGIPAGQNRHVAILGLMDSLIFYATKHNIKNLKILRRVADETNQARCQPPLDEKEMDKLWKQAGEFIGKKHPSAEERQGQQQQQEEAGSIPLTPEEQKQVEQREILYSKIIHEFRQPNHNLQVIPLTQLGMDCGDTPVVVSGTVIGLSTLVPDWSMIKFICKACNQANKSDIHDESKPPEKCRFCDKSQAGFNAQVDWSIQPRLNRQTILIQDGSESLPCILTGTQQEMWPVRPGQKIQALGIQKYETFYNSKTHRQDWLKYFKLLAIKPIAGQDVSYTDKDVEYFKQLASLPNIDFINDILVPSFAPHVRGNMNECKLVCIYTLASQGLERPFNAILLGPPARGKTECTNTTAALSHYGNITEFIHTSVAGLTTETIRDPISGTMIAKPGILATYSMACFTDMNAAVQHQDGKKLLLSMNHALEHKVATSGKAGGAQSFSARSAVLIDSNNYAANWYYSERLEHNLQFAPRSFLSRIDFGAIVPEETTEAQYEEIADANLDSYAENETPIKLHQGDWTDPVTGAPRLGFESLRKFFFYISQQPLPPLPKEDTEMRQYFKKNYAYVAMNDKELLVDGRYNRTALILARVRARLSMKDKADRADLMNAITFVSKWKNVETLDPKTGEKDANFLVGAPSKKEIEEEEQLSKLKQFQEAIDKAMIDDNGNKKDYCTLDDITYHCLMVTNSKWKDHKEVQEAVQKYAQSGKLMEKHGQGKYTPI